MTADIVAELRWCGEERFEFETGSHRFTLDGDAAEGATPMQHLAAAVGGCMGIDVAHILARMRTPAEALRLRLSAYRAPEPPRRFTRIVLELLVEGDVPAHNLERALALSRDRYCSAWASIRPEVELVVETSISPPPLA